jgi:hypothetical protein
MVVYLIGTIGALVTGRDLMIVLGLALSNASGLNNYRPMVQSYIMLLMLPTFYALP